MLRDGIGHEEFQRRGEVGLKRQESWAVRPLPLVFGLWSNDLAFERHVQWGEVADATLRGIYAKVDIDFRYGLSSFQ